MSTAKLAAGSYEVTATSLGEDALCWVGTTKATGAQQYSLGSTTGGSIAATDIVKVKKGQQLHLYCAGTDSTSGDLGGAVLSAGITAMRLVTTSKGNVHSTSPIPSVTKSIAKLLK